MTFIMKSVFGRTVAEFPMSVVRNLGDLLNRTDIKIHCCLMDSGLKNYINAKAVQGSVLLKFK
jgi:hypothetical protein